MCLNTVKAFSRRNRVDATTLSHSLPSICPQNQVLYMYVANTRSIQQVVTVCANLYTATFGNTSRRHFGPDNIKPRLNRIFKHWQQKARTEDNKKQGPRSHSCRLNNISLQFGWFINVLGFSQCFVIQTPWFTSGRVWTAAPAFLFHRCTWQDTNKFML